MVRSCAYNLLCCLTQSFNLQLEGRLYQSEGLCIPANNTLFIESISSTLAKNESHLTLEFVKECITGRFASMRSMDEVFAIKVNVLNVIYNAKCLDRNIFNSICE